MKIITALVFLVSMISCAPMTAAKGHTWCVAKPSATDEELINNIRYVCDTLKAHSCDYYIGKGSRCFKPDTLRNHASVLMNAYYVENCKNSWNCDFKGSGLVTITDPSYSECSYE